MLTQADAVLVTSPETKRLFQAKLPELPSAKFKVLPNGYDESDFRQPSQPPTDCLRITHTGTITELYRIEQLLKAVATCAARHPEVPMRLQFVGQVSAQLREQIKREGLLPITEFVPFVPHEESVRYLMQLRCCSWPFPMCRATSASCPAKYSNTLRPTNQFYASVRPAPMPTTSSRNAPPATPCPTKTLP